MPPQQIPDPPRLRDFKVLRLPLLELLAIAFLVCLSIGDIFFMTGGNGRAGPSLSSGGKKVLILVFKTGSKIRNEPDMSRGLGEEKTLTA